MRNIAQCFKFRLLRVLSIQIVLCFPKSYCSPLIRTQTECINKKLLVDVNPFNKAISKSTLRKAFKDVLLWQISF